jgi:hypothetical protein
MTGLAVSRAVDIEGVGRRGGVLVASLNFLLWVGIVLLVVGLVLNFVPIGGRRRRIF